MRPTATWLGLALFSALGGCGRSDTGVHIFAHVGSLEYDELRFQVTRGSGEVVVDPMAAGRYQGPFQPGDQDVLVYLRDDLGGTALHCDASALRAGEVVGQGAGDVTVVRGEMQTVDIFMGPSDGSGAGGGGGSGGDGSGGGVSGAGGSGGDTGSGTGGSGAPPGKPNGEACSLASECVTGHCVDGFCCESDCKMACHSCGLPESPGLCRPMADGLPDPRGMCGDQGAASCGKTGLCAAGGTCAFYLEGLACAEAGCADDGKTVLPAGTCDGMGKCKVPPKMKCMERATCVAGVCTEIPDLP